MTISSVGATGPGGVQRPHHHGHRSDPAAQSTTASTSTASTSATASDNTTPQAGAAKFASELQSILLSAQSGQPSADGSTASDPSTATDPADATDPTASTPSAGGVKHLADRLQDLLGDTGSAATASTSASGGNTLQDVLSRLQATLQQTLSKYQTATAAGATSTSLTA